MVRFLNYDKDYAVDTKDGIVWLTKEMYDCLTAQYRLIGWKEEKIGGITSFLSPKG